MYKKACFLCRLKIAIFLYNNKNIANDSVYKTILSFAPQCSIYTGSYIQFWDFFGFRIFGKIPLKSLWQAVLWENVGAEMLIGCVRNFLVLRICYKVDMGHVLSEFHVFSNLLFWSNTGFLGNVTFLVCLEQNPATKMTAWNMGSFHGFGKKSTLY